MTVIQSFLAYIWLNKSVAQTSAQKADFEMFLIYPLSALALKAGKSHQGGQFVVCKDMF